MLMRLLLSAPEIMPNQQFPFEVRYISYATKLANILEMQPSPDFLAKEVLHNKKSILGPLPFRQTSDFSRAEWAKCVFDASLRNILSQARKQNQNSQWYAEKITWNLLSRIEQWMPHTHCIFLVRDVRDVFVSSKAFNARRNTKRFNWDANSSEIQIAKRICSRRKAQLQHAIRFLAPSKSCLTVRYEDLIKRPEQSIPSLEAFLDCKLDANEVLSLKKAEQHVTSKGIHSSTERWRNELDPKVNEVFCAKLGEELRRLGYMDS